MNVPENLLYTSEHEWVKVEGDRATVGITDYAQHALGDIVFVELPNVGDALQAGEAFGVAESVKAVSDLFCPLSGTVIKANEALMDRPELLNEDPYAAWVIQIQIEDKAEQEALLNAEAYRALIEQER